MEEKIGTKRSELTGSDEIGLAINVVGFLLMIGGGSEDPSKFDANELFSFQRITLSPILIIAGYIVILYSIMKRSSKK
jgi:hypothetical protein